MELALVRSLFSFITDNIFPVIYIFAAIEVYLVVTVFLLLKRHESILLDVSDNLLKGFEDGPDKDSTQYSHEKIKSAIQFITVKLSSDPLQKKRFQKNAEKISERAFYHRHYQIEMYASVMSTLVQIFPLLGILGTILAIAQTTMTGGGTIDVSSLSSAFVLAMDTTILGISFSILFMIIESTFQPKIERVIEESQEYRQILANIYLS